MGLLAKELRYCFPAVPFDHLVLAMVVTHGIALLMEDQQLPQELRVVRATQRIGAVPVEFGSSVLFGKALVALERVEADDPPVEMQGLEYGPQVLADHRSLPPPGTHIEYSPGQVDDLSVDVRNGENPREHRTTQEEPQRPLLFVIGGLV